MFSVKGNVKSTLLCGPEECSKSFMFEAAIYWAEEGRRVVYITPAPLDSLPAGCHERSNPVPAAFKLMRFMYLENYEALAERLVELHTFVSLPSVLLIDDFDNYITNYKATEMSQDMHIARTCSIILDTMNSCSRILKTSVYICAWSSSVMSSFPMTPIYFRNIWTISEEDNGKVVLLQKCPDAKLGQSDSYKFHKLQDGARILKEVLGVPTENKT